MPLALVPMHSLQFVARRLRKKPNPYIYMSFIYLAVSTF